MVNIWSLPRRSPAILTLAKADLLFTSSSQGLLMVKKVQTSISSLVGRKIIHIYIYIFLKKPAVQIIV